ncbi:MAG TPA: excinuclease ABC subunit UvrC [Dehalococcoidales bacterium]|nr:excinuclease ABC subunit UvrC [Dehalococcoidales bacterium]
MTASYITEQLRGLPPTPGVYLLKDAEGNIIYVGKASSLRHRVGSYFGSGQKLTPKTRRMVGKIADLEYFVTASEQEALILELNLIKQHHPRYNVRLKDDKSFPYLKINLDEDWPRVHITRTLKANGGRYFGPFASAKSIRRTLKVLKGIFPFRSCTRPITGGDPRPCLEYDIGHCLAPCIGKASRAEYDGVIKQLILFLEGKQQKVVKQLENRMNEAAEAMDFEKAARLRDQIQAVEEVVEGQRIAAKTKGEQDVIAFSEEGDRAYVQVFFIRNSQLIGRESFVLQGARYEEPSRIMSSFVPQFYASAPHIPPLLLLQHPVEDAETLQSWLSAKRGGAVKIQVPRRGSKKQLVDIVAKNAQQGLEQLKIKHLASPRTLSKALEEIKKELNLPRPPERIEGYDISDIQGAAAVGSMVVFDKGKPKPAHYRRFKIKSVVGADDYAMLGEVLKRRFKRADAASGTWALRPDLVLIDGGKGQLNAALKAMRETGADSIPTAGLAKENEELFIPGRAKPIVLPPSSPGLQLLQRLRDEAHRFALGYHHKVRRRQTFASALDGVLGIGAKRKKALLRRFGSLKGIKEASAAELADVSGITESLARKIKENL